MYSSSSYSWKHSDEVLFIAMKFSFQFNLLLSIIFELGPQYSFFNVLYVTIWISENIHWVLLIHIYLYIWADFWIRWGMIHISCYQEKHHAWVPSMVMSRNSLWYSLVFGHSFNMNFMDKIYGINEEQEHLFSPMPMQWIGFNSFIW